MSNKMRLGISLVLACLVPTNGLTIRDVTRTIGYSIEFEYHINAARSEGQLFRPSRKTGRPGRATDTHSCDNIREVPEELRSATQMYPDGLGEFYQKYTEAYGIPVLGSSSLPDEALQRACYVVRFILADRYSVRNSYYQTYGRFAIMGADEVTTDIPEHTTLGQWWDKRARGLGATRSRPVSTGAEENVLCYSDDLYSNEDIAIHEFSHGAHLLGASYAIPDFDRRLQALYGSAKAAGLWNNTYAMTSDDEYFAEGVQSYFGVNVYADPPDGIHNNINTREALRGYDPKLYAFIEEFFPCDNTYIDRCENDREAELNQQLRINCDGNGGSENGEDESDDGNEEENCTDNNRDCDYWASEGECERNSQYMLVHCRLSCDNC